MPKQRKSFINVAEAMAKLDNWKQGFNHNFHGGDVVERLNSDMLGVVLYPCADIERYVVKWYVGPNPWNFLEGEIVGAYLIKSKKANPLKYKTSQRYPGPSSAEIDRLNAVYEAQSKNKVVTGKDVDKYMEILEEELKNKTINKFDEVDSVVDEELEEEPDGAAILIDTVDLKRKKVIEED